jgi:sigma-B regulation protein RsbU (phosphoserine phosphatase)
MHCSNGTARLSGERHRLATHDPRRKAARALGIVRAGLRLARAVQQQLFPPSPELAGFELGGRSYPAEATGGDYFDFIPLRDGSLGIAIGDVSGHGYGPALLMASTRAYLRALAWTHTDPSEMLRVANQALSDDLEGHFVTLFFAKLDPLRRSLIYASAGHPAGYVMDSRGVVKALLERTAYPLGVSRDADFPSVGLLTLEPGDLVLLVTDGVLEAHAPDNQPFGPERALQIVRTYQRDPASLIVTNLYHASRAFSQGAVQRDDITAVVLKVQPGP